MTVVEQIAAFFKCVSLRGHDFSAGDECARCKAPKSGTTLLDLLRERVKAVEPDPVCLPCFKLLGEPSAYFYYGREKHYDCKNCGAVTAKPVWIDLKRSSK